LSHFARCFSLYWLSIIISRAVDASAFLFAVFSFQIFSLIVAYASFAASFLRRRHGRFSPLILRQIDFRHAFHYVSDIHHFRFTLSPRHYYFISFRFHAMLRLLLSMLISFPAFIIFAIHISPLATPFSFSPARRQLFAIAIDTPLLIAPLRRFSFRCRCFHYFHFDVIIIFSLPFSTFHFHYAFHAHRVSGAR
jgi:hypothetical protein